MTIHITGDTHGEVSRLTEYKDTKPGDTVIITGDFGMLWRRNDFTKISKLNKAAEEKNITYLFCDGNHENFEILEAYPEEEKYGGKVGKISKYIYHLTPSGRLSCPDGIPSNKYLHKSEQTGQSLPVLLCP